MCEVLGCAADIGPAYQPDDRPFIERFFFGTVAATLSRRLPGTLRGRGAARLRDPADSLWLLVTTQELEELLDLNAWAPRLFAWIAEKALWLATNENGLALLQKRAQAFLAIVGVVADVLCRRFTEQCLPHSPLVMLLNCALG